MTTLQVNRRSSSNFAAAMVCAWARVYTAGTPEAVRARRLEQIESDVWEEAADGAAAGVPPFATSLNQLGRMVRGMPADLLWRTNYGGPQVNLNISLPRLLGGALVALAIACVVGTSIQGYDTSRDAWEDSFRTLGERGAAATTWNTVFFFLAGLGTLVIAGVFGTLLIPHQRIPAAIGTVLLASAGVFVLMGAGIYRVLSSEAVDFVEGGVSSETVANMRILALALDAVMFAAFGAIVTASWAIAVALFRASLAPRWTVVFPALSALCLAGSGLAEAVTDTDGWWWFLFMGTLMSVLAWLVVVGFRLLLRGTAFGTIPKEPLAA